ncbi:MAG: TlpA disulfide reductase family protein [Fuerstiella sp.]
MKIWKTQLLVMLMFFLSGSFVDADVSILRFQGQLVQPDPSGQNVSLREFDCVLIDDPTGSFFFVLDDPSGCPWPDSYGAAVNSASGDVSAHLLYRFDGNAYTISLPDLKMELPSDVNQQSTWQVGDWVWAVKDLPESQTSPITMKATERRGRKKEATFDQATGWLVSANLDVFMGRGEQFELQLKRTSVDTLSQPLSKRWQSVKQSLLQLQAKLNRRPDSQRTDLSARQIALAKSALVELDKVSEDLPVRPLLNRISQQVASQAEVMKASLLAKKSVLGKTVDSVSLVDFNGRPLAPNQFAGRPLVLHFWTYSQKALEEPYGQVAYLEFLHSKYGNLDVSVVGIITNPLLRSADGEVSALRSAKKAAEFMNLSYPVAYDDGGLQKLCDPESAIRDNSPLWLVLDSTGKVVHYHQGFYEIDRRAGLKDLNAAIDDVLKGAN